AEDPANGFLPSIGKLDHFVMPEDARVDTGVMQGGEVSQFYDPMIAKLIVHEDTREEAAESLADAAAQVEVWPVKTNAGFLVRCLEHPRFISGDVDTGFIGAEEADLLTATSDAPAVAALINAAELVHGDYTVASNDYHTPWSSYPSRALGLRLNAPSHALIPVRLNGERVEAKVQSARLGDRTWKINYRDQELRGRFEGIVVEVGDERISVAPWALGEDDELSIFFYKGDVYESRPYRYEANSALGGPASDGSLRAPMPGKIVAAPAASGDTVTKGQPIVVLEAMKMEHALIAPFDGVVESVSVTVGDQVGDGVVLAVVKAAATRAE
ncbi:MAG: methylcrotonoyl-CoA carboxylase, partial [Brevundimonas sp.]